MRGELFDLNAIEPDITRKLCKSKLSNKKMLNEKMKPYILSSTQKALTPET